MTKPKFKYLLFFAILLNIQLCFTQNEYKTKSDLYKYLKNSILERDAFSEIKIEK